MALLIRSGASARLGVIGLGALLLGCAEEPAPPPVGDPSESCADCVCPAGFFPDADLVCSEVQADGQCPAGSRHALGEATCAAVGVQSCPAGFVKAASGWGCTAILPAEPCVGATREEIGSATCVAIGACDAPFPPPEATIFVDDDYTLDELDDTHERSIGKAVELAAPGATIAVEAGTYLEGVILDKPVTLVGRCASQVSVQGSNPMMAGIQASGIDGVVVRGITLREHRGGVVAVDSTVTLEDVVIEDNREMGVASFDGAKVSIARSRIAGTLSDATGAFGFGVFAEGPGEVTMTQVVVTDNHVNGIAVSSPGSHVAIERSVVQRTHPNAQGMHGKGIAVNYDAALSLVESVVRGNAVANIAVTDSAVATVARSTIEGAVPNPGADGGHGVEIDTGGGLVVEDSTLAGNALWGAALGVGSASFARSVFRGSVDGGPAIGGALLAITGATVDLDTTALVNHAGAGIVLQDGAQASIDKSLVGDTVPSTDDFGIGVLVSYGSALVMSESTLSQNASVGLAVGGLTTGAIAPSTAEVYRTLVQSTRSDASGSFGRGAQVVHGTLNLVDSAVVGNNEVGVMAGEAGTVLTMSSSVVRSTFFEPQQGRFGHGVLVVAGAHAALTEGAIFSNEGIGLVVAGASSTVASVDLAQNQIGVHVQNDTTLIEVEEIPALPPPSALVIDDETRFLDNAARFGSGQIPLPSLL